MIFSEEEVFLILKKALPNADANHLNNIIQSVKKEGNHWQEADLDEHIHDEIETQILHDICKRRSNNDKTPKRIRFLFTV